jgi:hypothetical protein
MRCTGLWSGREVGAYSGKGFKALKISRQHWVADLKASPRQVADHTARDDQSTADKTTLTIATMSPIIQPDEFEEVMIAPIATPIAMMPQVAISRTSTRSGSDRRSRCGNIFDDCCRRRLQRRWWAPSLICGSIVVTSGSEDSLAID